MLNDDGTPVRWPGALTRNLLRAVDFLPFLYGVGLVAMLCNRDFKRLGDLAAGTVVVYQAEKAAAHAHIPQAPPIAPPVPLTLEEQRAVLDLAERSRDAHARARRGARRAARAAGRHARRRARGARACSAWRTTSRAAQVKQAPFEAAHAAEWEEFERFLDKPKKPAVRPGARCRARYRRLCQHLALAADRQLQPGRWSTA